MDGPWGHDVKQNKPGRERQTPYDFTHMWNINKLMDLENNLVVTKGKGREGWSAYTMEYYSAIKKRQNRLISNNVDGPWGYYIKQNKPGRERQTLYDFIHMWKINKHTDKENKLVGTRGEGGWGVQKRGNVHGDR